MLDALEKVKQIERELSHYDIRRKAGETLEMIHKNIVLRIETLEKLRFEIEEVSKELYYYDLLDHIGKIEITSLNICKCNTLLKKLDEALLKFLEDRNEDYVRNAKRIIQKMVKVGIVKCKEIVSAEQTSYEDVKMFTRRNNEIRKEIEEVYFSSRKRVLKNRIAECISNVRQNYKMLITAEIQLYSKVFGDKVEQIEKELRKSNGSTHDFAPDQNAFIEYLESLMFSIFKKVGPGVVKELLTNTITVKKIEERLTPELAFMMLAVRYYGENIVPGEVVML